MDKITESEIIEVAKRILPYSEQCQIGFEYGAKWMQEQMKCEWVDVDKFKPVDGENVLGCHFHDNWTSIVYYNERQKKWFNDWDHECECWPSHVMNLPSLPYSESNAS